MCYTEERRYRNCRATVQYHHICYEHIEHTAKQIDRKPCPKFRRKATYSVSTTCRCNQSGRSCKRDKENARERGNIYFFERSPTLLPSTRYEDIFDRHTAPPSSKNGSSSNSTAEAQRAQQCRNHEEEERLRMKHEGPVRKKKRDGGREGEEEDIVKAMIKVEIGDEEGMDGSGGSGGEKKAIGIEGTGGEVEQVGDGMEL